MINGEESKLWNNSDKNGKILFTAMPNALMCAIVRGDFGKVEMQIIVYICRMAYGFRREETCYLGSDDFKAEVGIDKPHFSKQMNTLLRKGDVFRAQKNGDKYKYAVNLLRYGCTMKYYKFVDAGYKLCKGECIFDGKSYKLGNCEELKNGAILYNPRGYDKKDELYTKVDINKDTKKDSASVSSSLGGATIVEATKTAILPATKITTTKAVATPVQPTSPLPAIYSDFEKSIWKGEVSKHISIIFEYMEIITKAGFGSGLIADKFQLMCRRENSSINIYGQRLNPDDCGEAIKLYRMKHSQR